MPRKKQRRAWGSITEIKRAKKYVLRWPDPGKKCGRATETFYGTYRMACDRLDAIHAKVMDDGPAPRYATVGDVYDSYVSAEYSAKLKAGKLKQRSFDLYDRTWRVNIAPRWSDVAMSDVRAIDVQDWLLSLTKSQAKVAVVVLKNVGDAAVRYELAAKNVFREKYISPSKSKQRTKEVYDSAQRESVYREYVRGTCVEVPYILAAFAGCRTGEALGLRCSEIRRIERKGHVFAIARIVRRMEQTGYEPMPDGDLKTPESQRTIVVPPPYGQAMLDIAVSKTSIGVEWLADRGDGLPLNRGTLTGRWNKVVPEDARIPMRNLRASWRTIAEMEWHMPPNLLEMAMGHKLPGVTGKHYMRPSESQFVELFIEEYLSKNAST